MEQVTIIGKKSKQDHLVSDFKPEESDYIIRQLTQGLKKSIEEDFEEEYEHDGERLKRVEVKAKDNSIEGNIQHVPVDYFGEKDAEVRVVLNIKPHGEHHHDKVWRVIEEMDFTASLTS